MNWINSLSNGNRHLVVCACYLYFCRGKFNDRNIYDFAVNNAFFHVHVARFFSTKQLITKIETSFETINMNEKIWNFVNLSSRIYTRNCARRSSVNLLFFFGFSEYLFEKIIVRNRMVRLQIARWIWSSTSWASEVSSICNAQSYWISNLNFNDCSYQWLYFKKNAECIRFIILFTATGYTKHHSCVCYDDYKYCNAFLLIWKSQQPFTPIQIIFYLFNETNC